MDEIEKLLRKISRQDRQRLLEVSERLLANKLAGLNVTKVKGTDFYKLRSGRFRIIFHRNSKTNENIIDHIRLRNEKTYRSV